MAKSGSGKSKPKPKSVTIQMSNKTNYSRSSKSNVNVEEKTNPVSGFTLLGLGVILFVALVLPTNGGGLVCFIPVMILFAMKDILNIPTKIFIGLLVVIGIALATWFISSIRGMGMY